MEEISIKTPVMFSQTYIDVTEINKLMNIKTGDRILTVAASGTHALEKLLANPEEIIAVDLHVEQLYLAKLQAEGMRQLTREEFCRFVGINRRSTQPLERVSIYNTICGNLDTKTKEFWDANIASIEMGIWYIGRLEMTIVLLGHKIFSSIHDKNTTAEFLALGDDMKKQIEFFETIWNTSSWRRAYKDIRVQGSKILKKSVIPANTDYGQACLDQFDKSIRNVPNNKNHLLQFLLTEDVGRNGLLPPYLREGNYELIKSRLGRIQWIQADIVKYIADNIEQHQPKFDGINLSTVVHHFSGPQLQYLIQNAAKASNPGAKLVYYNLPRVEAVVPDEVWDGAKLRKDEANDWGNADSIYFKTVSATVL
ncbi:unnamed protein product [Owenia fusiformis]|uniref:Uncharacterized protein n=1 Tax=Owenia fusiformis TaxID=6347 RepID=A0A8J1Y891_OWEFU|nr:unnamed protein product [Owenia fusiformis]